MYVLVVLVLGYKVLLVCVFIVSGASAVSGRRAVNPLVAGGAANRQEPTQPAIIGGMVVGVLRDMAESPVQATLEQTKATS